MKNTELIQLLEGGNNMNFKRLWVDDERPLPQNYSKDEWTVARSFHEAIVKLELMEFDEVSLDHDLASFYGYTEMTGYHIVQWLVRRKMDGKHVPAVVNVHSANPVGVRNMMSLIERYFK